MNDPVRPVIKPLIAPINGESHFSCSRGGLIWGVKSENPAYEARERPSNPTFYIKMRHMDQTLYLIHIILRPMSYL